jgi:hypothetical protein
MQDYVIEIKRTLLQMTAWGIVVCCSTYFIGDGWRIPGLILGIITSMIYFLLMCYRVNQSANMPVHKALLYMRVGWLIRLGFVVLMLVLSVKIPAIDFWSAVAGLFTLQVIMFLNSIAIVSKSFLRIP